MSTRKAATLDASGLAGASHPIGGIAIVDLRLQIRRWGFWIFIVVALTLKLLLIFIIFK
jgi:hypothetical protein